MGFWVIGADVGRYGREPRGKWLAVYTGHNLPEVLGYGRFVVAARRSNSHMT